MVRIIDMECSIPRSESSQPEPGHDQKPTAAQPAGYGMANYSRIFSSRREGADHRPDMSLDGYVEKVGKLGIVRSVPFGITNEEEAALLRRYPNRFIGLARISINAFKGMTGVRELERLVREEGFKALGVSALVDMIPASDRRYYPLYTKAAELSIPVRIYSSMNYANDRPYDLGHPRHLDQVAMDFPELTIIGGLGGWPWVNEMVALVRRHPKLHMDTSAHRAKYLGQPGSGWEMLMQLGNTLIQDKVLVGLSAGLGGQPHETLIDEDMNLPPKETVQEKGLGKKAPPAVGPGRTAGTDRGLPGAGRGGPREDVVVLERAQPLAGEMAGGLLADFGATVIKIEPHAGSPLRRRGPAIPGESSLYFQSENRGKYSVVAELDELTRAPWLAKLVASADALIEDLGPGRLESVGLAPDT